MSTDAAKRESGQALFREKAESAVGQRIFGGVSIVVPPSGRVALVISAAAVVALVAVTCLVEIPERSRAVGVLMPVGGLVDAVATRSGRIEQASVSTGDMVEKGQTLFTISDAAQLRGESAPEVKLRSLRSEMDLLEQAHARQREIDADSLIRIQEEADAASKQLLIAKERYDAHHRQLAILENRFTRRQKLLRGGHVPRDELELDAANMIRARAEGIEIRQMIATASQAIQTLARSRTEAQKQLELGTIQRALSVERLQGDIDLLQQDVIYKVSASEQSLIAQILVQPGDAVRSGQVLAKLRRPGERLQAWLYLATSTASQLRKGQAVEISLDAYPRQFYGTHTATVSSISGIALLPADIRAPMLLPGPVFEVRADLRENSVRADGRNWPLKPGTTFSADIIQRRLKMYEWLLRSLLGEAGKRNG